MLKAIYDDVCYTQNEVMQLFKFKNTTTFWRWIKQGKFPQADLNPNTKGKKWYGSTLKQYQKAA